MTIRNLTEEIHMTPTNPSARFYVIAFLIFAMLVWIIWRYARLIKCSWCKAPYSVFARSCGDLCWSCAGVFDRASVRYLRRSQ